MNIRVLIVVPLALVCGLSAIFLVKALRNPVAAPTIPRTGVVFALTEVATGEMVTAANLELRQVPTEDVPEDAVRKVEDAVERAAKATIDSGDMLRERKLAERGAGRGMAALIPSGMRAFTIQTPSFSSSLAGFLLPHDKVDVLLTAGGGGGRSGEEASTTTLLQNIEILAVHTNVTSPTANKINPDEARSVTLLVNPRDAQELDSGQNRGTLHLTLRNPTDKGMQAPKPPPVAPVVVAAPPPPKQPAIKFKMPPIHGEGTATLVMVRTLRGTHSGRETLKVRVPSHDTLTGMTVATPYGMYELDDSIVVDYDAREARNPLAQPLATPFDEAQATLTSIQPPK